MATSFLFLSYDEFAVQILFRKRTNEVKSGNCALCRKAAKLHDSHILPEFLFKQGKVYNEDIHTFTVKTSAPSRRETVLQKGPKEYLLCTKCEAKLELWENYAKELLFDGKLSTCPTKLGFWEVSGLNYDKLKLFQMSLIWRASVSSLSYFSVVDLGPHEERIRTMLVDCDPGEKHEYGCYMIRLVDPPDLPLSRSILMDKAHRESHRCYRLMAASFFWIFVVSSHSDRFRLKGNFLDKAGCIVIPVGPGSVVADWMAEDFTWTKT